MTKGGNVMKTSQGMALTYWAIPRVANTLL